MNQNVFSPSTKRLNSVCNVIQNYVIAEEPGRRDQKDKDNNWKVTLMWPM